MSLPELQSFSTKEPPLCSWCCACIVQEAHLGNNKKKVYIRDDTCTLTKNIQMQWVESLWLQLTHNNHTSHLHTLYTHTHTHTHTYTHKQTQKYQGTLKQDFCKTGKRYFVIKCSFFRVIKSPWAFLHVTKGALSCFRFFKKTNRKYTYKSGFCIVCVCVSFFSRVP